MGVDEVMIRIDPEDSVFQEGTQQWHRGREDLLTEINRQLGPQAVAEGKPEPGDKGLVLVPIIVALGSAGVFTALAKCFESWLRNRPGQRRLKVRATVGDREIVLDVTADNLRADGLSPLLQALPETLK